MGDMDFDVDVIKVSYERPVVVDFWAPWCGPCQVIGPVLEDLEKEQSRWKLVKVNVDDNPQISQQYGIRGIPDVRLFANGVEVDRFTGALPRHQIEKWLTEHIPDERLGTLEALTSAAKQNQDLSKLRAFVSSNEDFKPGFLALAKLILWENPEESRLLLASIKPTDKEYAMAAAIIEMSELLSFEASDETGVSSLLAEVKSALLSGDRRTGIEQLIQAVMLDKNFADELPRRAAVAFFQIMGPDHELTKAYRRKFDMALY